MEALITLDCSNYSNNMINIIKAFQLIGWNTHNNQNEVEFLPIGDKGNYDWCHEKLSERELYDMLTNKTARKEQIGIHLFYNNGLKGISLTGYDTSQIIIGISINRKIIRDDYTDTAWYLENIIYKLLDLGIEISSYKIEEYQD